MDECGQTDHDILWFEGDKKNRPRKVSGFFMLVQLIRSAGYGSFLFLHPCGAFAHDNEENRNEEYAQHRGA